MAPQTPTSPYIQQLYAASASPYGQVSPNIMQLMQSSTGNPLLDMYTGQYAAMGSMGYQLRLALCFCHDRKHYLQSE